MVTGTHLSWTGQVIHTKNHAYFIWMLVGQGI